MVLETFPESVARGVLDCFRHFVEALRGEGFMHCESKGPERPCEWARSQKLAITGVDSGPMDAMLQ